MPTPSPRLRENNFDLIRLVLAAIVAVVHVAALSLESGLAWIPSVLSSTLAVKAFFVVSGFLIVMSYERSSSWRSYADKRARRLYPAYAVVIVSSAVLLWFVSRATVSEYVSATWWRYLGANLLFLNFLQPALPGVFESNPIPVVNGALWTLKIEVMFYAAVPALVWLCRRFGWQPVLLSTYLASTAYLAWVRSLYLETGEPIYETLMRQLPGQLTYFAAGAALYYGFSSFDKLRVPLAGLAIAVLAADQVYALPLFEPAALAVVTVAVAFGRVLARIGRYGDFSYGLYILHFPLIQLLVDAGPFRGAPWALLGAALLLALGGAVLLWHLVEKRWLLASSHYRRG